MIPSRLASPRLVCLAIHSVMYQYIAQGEMHAFRTLRSPCHQRLPYHQRPQRPPYPIGRCVSNRRRVSKRRHRVPQRRRCVSKRRRVTHHRGVTNGPRVTHHRVSLTAPESPTTECD